MNIQLMVVTAVLDFMAVALCKSVCWSAYDVINTFLHVNDPLRMNPVDFCDNMAFD